MSFQLDHVERCATEEETSWAYLEGRRLGRESAYPTRVKVVGGRDRRWSEAFAAGSQESLRKMKPSDRRRIQKHGAVALATPPGLTLAGIRRAIRDTGILVAVAWIGPRFRDKKSFDAWIDGTKPYTVGDTEVPPPANAREIFTLLPEGEWGVSLQVEPPEEWRATDEQIKRLLKIDEFVSQVANVRRILDEDGSEALDEELKN